MLRLVLILSCLASAGAYAQTQPSADVDTVKSGIGEESLAPVVVKKTVVSATTVSTAAVPAAAVSETAATGDAVADPFVVKGVVATLSGTTGFDRDAALEIAAREALPGVLVSMGNDPAKAAKTVKGLGSAMRFVKSYKVVKETLIPSYVLTTDLTFNGAILLKNFGGKMPVAKTTTTSVKTTTTETSEITSTAADVPVAGNTPVKQWVVRIAERDPAAVDKVRLNLNRQASTKATYRLLTSAGAELLVETPLSAGQISQYAGHSVEVVELEIPLPTQAVTDSSHPWQGQAEPNSPATPAEPEAPATPAEPGSY